MIDSANPDFANTPVSARRPRFCYEPAGDAAPVVSVVTPFYNAGALFHETAQALFGQSLQQWEWIIVNDGSTDAEALQTLGRYRLADPRVRVIDLPTNAGSAAARNRGVEAAATDLIVHLDSDDLLEPVTIEKWYWFMMSYPEYGAVTSYIVHFGAREWIRQNGFEIGRIILDDNLVGMRSMVRRAVHLAAGGFNEDNRQGLIDWEYWLRVARAGFWGGTVPEPLPWYRRRKGHGKTWHNWTPAGRRAFEERIRHDYASLWRPGGFPQVATAPHPPFARVPDELPCANLLRLTAPRRLVVCGAGVSAEQATANAHPGTDLTVASTAAQDGSWLAAVARCTPDVFILPNVVRLWDQPRLLRYLIASRRPDEVVVVGSEMGCLLAPYLRAHLPGVRLSVDARAGRVPEALAAAAQAVAAGGPPGVGLGRACAAQAVDVIRLSGAPLAYDPAVLARRPLQRHAPPAAIHQPTAAGTPTGDG